MNINNFYRVNLPIDYIRTAVRDLNDTKAKIKALQKEADKYGTVEQARRDGGERGVEARDKALKELAANADLLKRAAIDNLASIKEKTVKELDAQFIPNGDDLLGDNAADVALLNANLIKTPEKLLSILEKHDNAAFRLLAAEYAAKNNWDDFDYIDKENSVREYCTQVFKGLEACAEHPTGYNSIQYLGTPGEYRRMADGFGLTHEFHNSNGNSIDEVIVAEGSDGSDGSASAE